MKEFLDHLVSRSLNLPAGPKAGDFLRPRLPSLFEDPAGTVGAESAFPAERIFETQSPEPELGEGRAAIFPPEKGAASAPRNPVSGFGESAPARKEAGTGFPRERGGNFSMIRAGDGEIHASSDREFEPAGHAIRWKS